MDQDLIVTSPLRRKLTYQTWAMNGNLETSGTQNNYTDQRGASGTGSIMLYVQTGMGTIQEAVEMLLPGMTRRKASIICTVTGAAIRLLYIC